MTNLDSILKSRDITLQTKVHLVKAMVFSVIMYGCQSQTIKKADCPLNHQASPAFNVPERLNSQIMLYRTHTISFFFLICTSLIFFK